MGIVDVEAPEPGQALLIVTTPRARGCGPGSRRGAPPALERAGRDGKAAGSSAPGVDPVGSVRAALRSQALHPRGYRPCRDGKTGSAHGPLPRRTEPGTPVAWGSPRSGRLFRVLTAGPSTSLRSSRALSEITSCEAPVGDTWHFGDGAEPPLAVDHPTMVSRSVPASSSLCDVTSTSPRPVPWRLTVGQWAKHRHRRSRGPPPQLRRPSVPRPHRGRRR